MTGVTLGYISAEAALPGPVHPIHWGVALLGAGAGYLLGQGVNRLKEGRQPLPAVRRGSHAPLTTRAGKQRRRT